MSIQFENYPISDILTNQGKIKEIYFENSLVYSSGPKEEFLFTINSGEDGLFNVGYGGWRLENDLTVSTFFDFMVDWGDGTSENAKGRVDRYGGGYYEGGPAKHTYAIKNKNYQIRVYPSSTSTIPWAGDIKPYPLSKLISVDSQIPEQMMLDVNYSGDYRANSFGSSMFYMSSIQDLGKLFVNIQKAKSYANLGSYMFNNCKNLVKIKKIFPNINPNIVNYPFGDSMYGTFAECTNLRTGIIDFMSCFNTVTQEQLDNSSYAFVETFKNCTSIQEEISPRTIPLLRLNLKERSHCFEGCPADKIVNCPANWK